MKVCWYDCSLTIASSNTTIWSLLNIDVNIDKEKSVQENPNICTDFLKKYLNF